MDWFLEGVREALGLLFGGDPEVWHALFVTTSVTVLSILVAAALALPYGVWLGLSRPRFEGLQVVVLRFLLFVPTVAIGLIVYSLLSRRGFLGSLDLLYTKTAIVVGNTLLAFPILAMFAYSASRDADGQRIHETARTLGASTRRAFLTLLSERRHVLLGAGLVATARVYAELGIAATVGGGIRVETRTLASTVQLHLQRGDFARGVACTLILLALALTFTALHFFLQREKR